jgi:putative nucleotidyltransferase with HDIG domain
MRIAREAGLPLATHTDLYYALLLKDCGCSSNASRTFHALVADDIRAKSDLKTVDWTRLGWESLQYVLTHAAKGKPFVDRCRTLMRLTANQTQHARESTKIRCERGHSLARLMGLSEATADAIAGLDEHWDGSGHPKGLRTTQIPILSRIILLAQTLEAFLWEAGPEEALRVARQRSKQWFDPDLVKVACSLSARGCLWTNIASPDALIINLAQEPEQRILGAGDYTLDSICMAFGQVVDAKSPFTYNHSNGVANAAVAIARTLGLSHAQVVFLRHAALLHDIGKLGVSNSILEKPGKLDDAEWEVMREHPRNTWRILNGIPGFSKLSEVAASHHERLNGTGYFRGLTAEQLSLEARILVVADMFDALAADRPYREGLPLEKVFQILRGDAPHAIDARCVEALEASGVANNQSYVGLQMLNERLVGAQRVVVE